MPKLSQLTDYQTTPEGRIYVSPNMPTSDNGDLYASPQSVNNNGYSDEEYFSKPVAPMPELPSSNVVERIIKKLAETEFSPGTKTGNRLFGTGGEERYQLWPEKVVRSALTAIPDAYSGKIPMYDTDPETGELVPSQAMIGRALDMAAFAGVGGVGGTGEAAGTVLGATPSLRPALKYNGRLYKGKEGQQHMDVIPDHLYNDFQQKAMSGDDISHYNFGFVNDKGHFLDREAALKYGIDTGLIDPQAGKFGALTSTLMADSSKPGMAIEATAKTAQPFYSALEHNVSQISQNKMNGEAWLGTLANKPGVKPEELDWTGLKSFLEENKGKAVTKAQIEAYLAENNTKLNEVWKGDDRPEQWTVTSAGGPISKLPDTMKFNSREAAELELNRRKRENPNSFHSVASLPSENTKPKYESYQLPGGENYREMLMTLPSDIPKFQAAQKANDARIRELRDSMHGTSGSNEIRSEISRLQNENQAIQQKIREADLYKSSHWDEPNILAHVRMNDRTIEGKKSLHLEEIQSDWHQQGRDKGYSDLKPQKAYEEYEDNLYKRAKDDFYRISEEHNIPKDKADQLYAKLLKDRPSWEQSKYLGKDEQAIHKQKWDAAQLAKEGVPDAPFKKTWHELALKRMLREAAEKGYDRLSWTPGEAQAARYDLSKQIGSLKATPIVDQHGLKYEIRATNKNGTQEVLNQVHSAEELPNVVGKEMAKKIIDESEGKKPVHFKGLDLKVGGEGMKGFYDQIIPKALEKLGKEHGVKVQKGDLGSTQYGVYDGSGKLLNKYSSKSEAEAFMNEAPRTREIKKFKSKEGTPVHYIDIPQSLKDRAMQKGFPLFSSAYPGYIFKPVDGNPFEEQK